MVPRPVIGLVPTDANKAITFPTHHIVSRGGEYFFVPSLKVIKVRLYYSLSWPLLTPLACNHRTDSPTNNRSAREHLNMPFAIRLLNLRRTWTLCISCVIICVHDIRNDIYLPRVVASCSLVLTVLKLSLTSAACGMP